MHNEAVLRAPGAPANAPGIPTSHAILTRGLSMPADLANHNEMVQATEAMQVRALPAPSFGYHPSSANLAKGVRLPIPGGPGRSGDIKVRLSFTAEGRHLNWRVSIVDTLRLLGMDPSIAGRKALAAKLGYSGELDGSAGMNIWLHQKVLRMSGCDRPQARCHHESLGSAKTGAASATSAAAAHVASMDAIPATSSLPAGAGDVEPTLPASAQESPQPAGPSPSPAHRINPTKRTLRFVVPVTDGPAYLGDVNLAVAPDDSLSVQAERLLQMLEPILKPDVFARLRSSVGKNAEITTAQLAAEKIVLSYDSEKLALAIAIPVQVRRNASVSLRSPPDAGAQTLEPATFSAYLNFRSSVDLIERGSDRGLTAPVSLVDGAVRIFGAVAEGEAYLSLRGDERFLRRTGSRLVYDDTKDVIRFTLGDLQPFARNFQSTPTVAGLSAQRFYNVLEPWREYRSTGSQGFTIFAPSMVETMVNGRSVERKLLQPGNYTLQDFPLAEGANNVKLLIQDEAGKQRTVEFSMYSSRALLEPGVTEFSAFAGVYSRPTIAGIAYSGRMAASGFVRMGLSQQFTAGLNMQADGDAQQAGGEFLFGSDLGLIGFDLAGSRRTAGGTGFAADVSYEKIIQSQSATRSMSLHAVLEIRSPKFAIPGALVAREPLAQRISAGWSIGLGRDTFVSADAQYLRDRVERRHSYGLRLSSGVGLSETLALIGEAEWNKPQGQQSGGILRIGIRKRIGSRSSAQAEIDTRGNAAASLQMSNGTGIGSWNGSVDVNRNRDGTNVNAQASLTTNRFDLGLTQFGGYRNSSDTISDMRTSFRFGTAIAFADGALAVGRPIQQAFLIAEPHRSLNGATVRVDPQQNREQARSGALGGAVDGLLSAHSPRTLVYDVPEAPPGYDLGAGNVQIVPPYKAGYNLEIGSDYHIMVIGRLLDGNGEPISLLAGKAIDLKAPKRPAVTMFTSHAGKFAAQGLRPGKWRIEMPTTPEPTVFEIDVKDDPSGTIRLGDIRPLATGAAR